MGLSVVSLNYPRPNHLMPRLIHRVRPGEMHEVARLPQRRLATQWGPGIFHGTERNGTECFCGTFKVGTEHRKLSVVIHLIT